jgi:hypothetical protein
MDRTDTLLALYAHSGGSTFIVNNKIRICIYSIYTPFQLIGAHKLFYEKYKSFRGHAVALLVEVLRYKPESRGFDSR